jgi:hypothetical protein
MRTTEKTAREKLARWMIIHDFTTGHGDTFDDLLKEMSWQVKELRQQKFPFMYQEQPTHAQVH